jgi:peptidyl-prolyl cis-trans isomerase C
MLEALKINEGQLREHVWADLRWNKYAAAQATDKALRELFDGNKEMFDGSTVHARHVLLMPPAGDEKAAAAAVAQLLALKKQIEEQVAAGLAKQPASDNLAKEKARAALTDEAFAAAAKDKSACPSKAQGGDVGWFRRAGFMVEPFSKAAFALKPFEVSDVVKTPFGYHLLLVVERRPGRDVKFEDVKELAKEVYCDRLHEMIAAQIRPKSRIVVNPPPKP